LARWNLPLVAGIPTADVVGTTATSRLECFPNLGRERRRAGRGSCLYLFVQSVLSAELQAQLNSGRQLLAELRDALTRFGAAESDQAALAASIRQLDEFFLLVVVGEFNAGKSAFINALAGHPILREGVTPTTARIHVLKHGDTVAHATDEHGLSVSTAPVELLRDVHIVDTPGTNAIIREHEQLTNDFVPRADLVLFVTSADRPFTETERAFLDTIRGWGKKIVIVVNKADIFQRPEELEEVLAFVRASSQRLLGVTPEVFAVSARQAMRAKQGEPALWASSRFETVERYIKETLDHGNRFRLKLANPVGVGQTLAHRYATIADERLALLREDLTLLDDIDRQLTVQRADLSSGFELRMTAVEKVLGDMEARGHAYFEDTLRLGRIMDLLNRARIQKEFEDRVVADAPRQIDRRVSELIDWLIDQDFRQWQAVTSAMSDRAKTTGSRVLGAPDVGTFHSDRSRLIDAVGREAQRVVETYDKQREASAIANDARAAVTTAAAVGGAAVGLGTLVTLAASTAAADVTGILLASLVAALGFLVIPARRRKAKAEMQEKISVLRASLAEALRTEFERALQQGRSRIDDAVAPYSRFVRAEQERWTAARTQLAALRDRASAFRDRLAA
jgi:small GTP-binding protein